MSATATAFNNFVETYTAMALFERGLVSFDSEPKMLTDRISSAQDRALISAAIRFNLLTKAEDQSITTTEKLASYHSERGYFTWLLGGYGQLLTQMGAKDVSPNQARKSVRGDLVATGSDQVNQEKMRPIFIDLLKQTKSGSYFDLGCGNAGRLIDIAKVHSNRSHFGIDVSEAAVSTARSNLSRHNLANQVKIFHGDALENDLPKPAEQADVVTTFMMMHDLFTIYGPEGAANIFINKFPNASQLIVADTFQSETWNNETPFTAAFELIHAYLEVSIFKPEDYQEQFTKVGFRMVKKIPFGVPNTFLMLFER